MAEGGFDEMEMNEFNDEFKVEYDSMSEGEINTEYSRLEELNRSNPNDENVSRRMYYISTLRPGVEETSFPFHDNIRKIAYLNLKTFIEEKYDVKVNPYSYEWIKMRLNIDVSENNNIKYRRLLSNGERGVSKIVLNREGDNFTYNTSKTNKLAVEDFKKSIDKVIKESKEIDEISDTLPMIDITPDVTSIPGLSEIENRELNGVLNPRKTIDSRSRRRALEIQEQFTRGKIDEIDNQIKNADPLKLKELAVRRGALKNALEKTITQGEKENVRDEQEGDITRLQKFKEWAKENMLGLSAVGIAIAGIVTSIVVAGRKAIYQGAKAVGAFGKMLAKVGKSLGPLLAPLMSLLANVISWGAKGLLWLSQNLFVLVIAGTYFAYEKYKSYNK